MSVKPLAMRDVFLDAIFKAMALDDKIFFVCADFGSPVLDRIRASYPDRYLNVGIAEQNLINVSSGLALEGFTVFAYAIAPFITMRCYEQIRVNLALLSEVRPLNVNLVGVGAGCSYVVSGPTHQCYEDISIMRALPNVEVLSPADHITARFMLDHCLAHKSPKYLRLDAQVLPVIEEGRRPEMDLGLRELKSGAHVCVIATGYMVHSARKVLERLAGYGIEAGLIDLFNLSSFDPPALEDYLAGYRKLVTMEEGFRGRGGLDSLLFDFVARKGLGLEILNLGIDNSFSFELGSREELHGQFGIGVANLTESIQLFLAGREHEISTDA